MDTSDPYSVFLAIATNIPQRLKTGFVVQVHIYSWNILMSFFGLSDVLLTLEHQALF